MVRNRLLVLAMAGALVLPLAVAQARTTPKPKAQDLSLGSQSVPGVCMLSRAAVFAQSKAGKAATARLNQLAAPIKGKLNQEHQTIQDAVTKFQDGASNMTASERESQQKALQARVQQFQQEEQENEARLNLTQNKATQRIAQTLDPIIVAVYKQRGCGILLDRDRVLGGNPMNDLTAAVIKGLDAKMPTINFNLASLPQQPSGRK